MCIIIFAINHIYIHIPHIAYSSHIYACTTHILHTMRWHDTMAMTIRLFFCRFFLAHSLWLLLKKNWRATKNNVKRTRLQHAIPINNSFVHRKYNFSGVYKKTMCCCFCCCCCCYSKSSRVRIEEPQHNIRTQF